MRKKRFLAALLALLMLFSLVPTLALAEGDEDEGEIVPVETEIEETETPEAAPEEPEALPEPEPEAEEPEAEEPEAEPVAYDLWVCGIQVTDSNKNLIVTGVVFDPNTNTLTMRGGSSIINPAELTNGAVIYSELPELIINVTGSNIVIQSDTAEKLIYANGGNVTLKKTGTDFLTLSSTSAYYGIYVANGNLTVACEMEMTAPQAEYGIFVQDGDLALGKVGNAVPVLLFNQMKNAVGMTSGTISGVTDGSRVTLTINGTRTSFASPTIRSDVLENAMVACEGDLTTDGKLGIYSKSARFGIFAPNGTVSNTGNLAVDLVNNSTSGTNLRDADSCVYAEYGFRSSGVLSVNAYDVNNGYGIKVMDGDVTITGGSADISAEHTGIYCDNGDVNVSGTVFFMINHVEESDGLSVSSGAYAANGSITLGGVGFYGGAKWVLFANGPIYVTGDVEIENVGDLVGGNGIKNTQGSITLDGGVTIEAINGIVSEGEEGILIGGDATIKAKGRNAINAGNGSVTVRGNLDARGATYCTVTAKGDITVEGNAYVTGSSNGYDTNPGVPMESTGGSINVKGNLTCSGTKNPAYAKNDIRVGGNAQFTAAVASDSTPGDFSVKAENGEITIGGTLTCKGKAACSVWAGTSVTVEKDVTITNDAEDSVGIYAVGFINVVSGKWDVDAGAAALRAGNGIEIPEGYGVTLPEGGKVVLVDGVHTVTEADGATVAAHAIIEEKAEETIIVTFDAGEGTVEPATLEVTAGEALGELPVPAREGGWVFMGWYLEPAATPFEICQGTAVTAETSFDADTTVYAHWRLPGDVNGDGKVNTADVSLLSKYVKARGEGVEIVPFSGNVDGGADGKVNTADVTLLSKYVKARGDGVTIY